MSKIKKMRQTRIWLGILFGSMFVGGIVGVGATLGKVYQEYYIDETVRIEEVLDINCLNKIYIRTDAPLRIEETTEEPKVLYKAQVRGANYPDQQYAVNIEQEGDQTVIQRNRPKVGIDLTFVAEEELIVYLPKQAIEVLQIESQGERNWTPVSYSGTNDIEKLHIENGGRLDLKLEGNYGEVSAKADFGEVVINTESLTSLELKGGIDQVKLEGGYQNIAIELHNAAISIMPTQEIEEIQLKGYDNDVYMKLPSEYSGFEVIAPYNISSEKGCFDSNIEGVKTTVVGEKEIAQLGNQATKVLVEENTSKVSIIR